MDPAGELIGQVLEGRYHVRRLIGRGGMGVVYEAEAIRLARPCAIKVLLPEFTGSEAAVQRFRREAQVVARIKHPHVVDVFDTGTTADGAGFIAMELLAGESLAVTLHHAGRLPWPRVRHIAVQVCRALAAAHAQHVVHRDMKPENCLRTTQDGDPDFIKVLDFGIAKLTDADHPAPRLTATNAVVGTYAYMAVEQMSGLDCDHRVDVWAVGVMLYEMLTGVLPFAGDNQGQIWTAIFQCQPTPMREVAPDAGIPAMAEEVVRRALARDREARYASADDLAAALLAVQDEFVGTRVTAAPGPAHAQGKAAPMHFAAAPTLPAHPVPRPATDPVDPRGRTEFADTDPPALRSTPPAPRRLSRRALLLFASLGAAPALVLVVALQSDRGAPEAGTQQLAGSALPEPPPALTTLPQPAASVPSSDDTPSTTSGPITDLPISPTPVADSKETATTKKGARETYTARVEASLARLESRVRDQCVGLVDSVSVDLEIRAATGKVIRADVQGVGRVTIVSLCITKQIKAWSFPRSDTDENFRKTHKFSTR